MNQQLAMLDRWCRYRYGTAASPQAVQRIRRGGVALPIVSLIGLLTSVAVSAVAILLSPAMLSDGPALSIWLAEVHPYAFVLAPFVSGQLGFWAWWEFSRTTRSNRWALLAASLVALFTLPTLCAVFVEVLALVALLWGVDVMLRISGGLPIEQYVWGYFVG